MAFNKILNGLRWHQRIAASFIRRYYGDEYIHINQIAEEIRRARKDEADRLLVKHDEEIRHIIELKDMEMHLRVSELNAEIARMAEEAMVERALRRKMDIMGARQKKTAKKNFHIASELKFFVKQFTDVLIDVQRKIEGVETRAQLMVDKIEGDAE